MSEVSLWVFLISEVSLWVFLMSEVSLCVLEHAGVGRRKEVDVFL